MIQNRISENITTAEVEVHASDAAAMAVSGQLPGVVQTVVDEIDRAARSDYVQVTASRVTPHIGAKARNIIYTLGVILGVVGTVAAPIAAVLTGDAQVIAYSAGTIALALTNLMAKLNLSKTADDLAKEHAPA